MKKQSAVEWLVNHWKKLQSEGEKMSWQQIIDITELAKAMEKQQIIDAIDYCRDKYIDSENYYNKTYGK